MRNRAVFLDRDGTILNERGYLSDPSKMVFYPSVFGALKRLKKAGFKLVIVSNQSGIGRGYFTLSILGKIHRRFTQVLRKHGVRIDGIYFCPHLPDAGCACRKPKAAMINRAAKKLRINVKKSFIIGDQVRDVQLAKNVGARGVLVLTGAGRVSRTKVRGIADKVARNLSSSADWILSSPAIK